MKKILKKTLKFFAWTFGVLLLLGTVSYFALDQKRPEGVEGPEAELLADKMLAALNKPAFDELRFLEWTYRGGHHYFWDKHRNLVEATHGDVTVLLQPDSMRGLAYDNGVAMEGKAQEKAVEKALTGFWNDGFWLMAPFKVRDPGTIRSVVTNADGTQSLMVTYSSGGRTPGDSYLWHLDPSGRPNAWQFWVKILPIGGLRFGWEDWIELPGGAWVSTTRSTSLVDLKLKDVHGGQRYGDLGRDEDPFRKIEDWLPE